MDKQEYPGKVKVSASIDVRFGEMWFEVEGKGRMSVRNKCLYDALSRFDIKMDRAKEIVTVVANDIASCRNYYVDLCDYRVSYEEETIEPAATEC
jgi:hypothetical protein